MTDPRRRPDEFLQDVRDMRTRRENPHDQPVNAAAADQMQAASRDARKIMGDAPDTLVVDIDVGEREEALILALGAAADRRGHRSAHGLANPRPDVIDLTTTGWPGHCDVCETRAHRLHDIYTQYASLIFRARLCVRCRKFAPPNPQES